MDACFVGIILLAIVFVVPAIIVYACLVAASEADDAAGRG